MLIVALSLFIISAALLFVVLSLENKVMQLLVGIVSAISFISTIVVSTILFV